MHLTPREQEKLLIYTAGQLAADRKKRGLHRRLLHGRRDRGRGQIGGDHLGLPGDRRDEQTH
ncbi:MAG: hypothetical protein HP494_07280 [Nitrospira sp.]|nr:hypothetical protein [Nitrospira sp.]